MKIETVSGQTTGRTYQERVLAHAKACLDLSGDAADFAGSLREFLKIENRRSRIWHNLSASGVQTAASRAFVTDILVRIAFARANATVAASASETSGALLAVGGYGRAELAPFSDVDLIFLYSNQRLSQMKLVSENLLQLLWDAGLTVGYSFRTVGDCVTAALDDAHLSTALVHNRFLAGNEALHKSLQHALEKDRRRHMESFVAAIKREWQARNTKFGSVVCAQEPNVKESAGGLRDYQTALWLAHARHGYASLGELRAHNFIAEREAQKIIQAHEFLWRIRHAMHFMMKRKSDRLSLDLQPALAEQFGYRADGYSLGSEQLMRDYYRHARELNAFGEAMLARFSESESGGGRFFRKRSVGTTGESFSIRSGRLNFDGEPAQLRQNALAMLNAFALAQAARVTFSFHLRELLHEGIRNLSADFRESEAVSAGFIRLLRRRGRGGFVLRLMHDTGFLARLIPEFGRVRCLVQHDLYHHYTVDEHSLRATETLDALHTSEDRHRSGLRTVLAEVENPALLYLAALLHDIGKGRSHGHVAHGTRLARNICERLQLKESDTKKVVLLVNRHVAMSHIAQRRDLNEVRVVAEFARDVETLDGLNMLLLLTYADLNAVGPGVWTEWKATLLWDLYRRARKVLTGTDTPADDEIEFAQYKKEIAAASPSLPKSEIERHLALLPDRYTRITTPAAVAAHIEMAESARGQRPAFSWERQGFTATKLTVCTRDRHALFADLAGSLAAQGIEILSAELNTREDGLVIDEFILRQAATSQAIDTHHYQKLEPALDKAAAGELNVSSLIERWHSRNAPRKRRALVPVRRRSLPRVSCDNEMSSSSTIVEVHALDEPGLAHKIARVLADLGLEISCARIATERSDALDVFYVTDRHGEKLSQEAMCSVETMLGAALTRLETVPGNGGTETIAARGANEKSRSDHQAASA